MGGWREREGERGGRGGGVWWRERGVREGGLGGGERMGWGGGEREDG